MRGARTPATVVMLADTAAGGEGEGGAEEQNAEDAAAAEDVDNLNTNAGDKPSNSSGKSQHDDDADKSAAGLYLVSLVRNSIFPPSLNYNVSLFIT